ncbi:hypothetical protein [Streptococcus dysgalactiae]|uniref:hypothetical protein n=1 Tax=Streptococcus dysgalactiae TaxID=1334 RepID=UPI003983A948
MSKTIKEIADDLGYSKTYVSQIIKSHNLQSSLRKEGNKFIIDEELEKTIKSIITDSLKEPFGSFVVRFLINKMMFFIFL